MNWAFILASAFAALGLVAGIFAWIAEHPQRAAPQFSGIVGRSGAPSHVELSNEPEAQHSAVFAATPTFHRAASQDVIAKSIAVVEEEPPPLPPPASLQNREEHLERPSLQMPEDARLQQPTGESYGTQVFFLNNPATAAKVARRDHKLLFVMHISGNFEDSCFT